MVPFENMRNKYKMVGNNNKIRLPVTIATNDSSGFQAAARIPDSNVPSTSN